MQSKHSIPSRDDPVPASCFGVGAHLLVVDTVHTRFYRNQDIKNIKHKMSPLMASVQKNPFKRMIAYC